MKPLHFFKRFGQWWCIEQGYNPKTIEAYHEDWPAYGGATKELAYQGYQRCKQYEALADSLWRGLFP